MNAGHGRQPRSHRSGGGSAKGLIFLLVLAHLVFVAYWGECWVCGPAGHWMYDELALWRQRHASGASVCHACGCWATQCRLARMPPTSAAAPLHCPAALMWLRQRRRQRTDGRQRSAVSTPKAVGCTYDWTATVPQVSGGG